MTGPSLPGRHMRLFLLTLVPLTVLLAIGYALILRTDYIVLYDQLKPKDAAAIVAELERRGLSFKLADGGTAILVAEEDADPLRVALAGSDLPLGGAVGFELFNESDMGLTDFAQKINYQRALQGELARTIIALEDVEDARVHLAMPERGLFRSGRTPTKAAVTVAVRKGRTLDPARVEGIRRLVAAAVPELSLGDVVVLDEAGRLISPEPAVADAQPAADEEHVAVQNYYRARGRRAAEAALPGVPFDLRVLALPAVRPEAAAAAPSGDGVRETQVRDFALRITVLTPTLLNAEDQTLVANAVREAVLFDDRLGDALTFGVSGPGRASPVPTAQSAPALADDAPATPDRFPANGSLAWAFAIAGAAAGILFLLLLRRRAIADGLEGEAFASRLRAELATFPDDRIA